MALISYLYQPSLHDLYLYEDHTISWTNPSPSSQVVKRPYAYNPNSWLYGYRKSLQGINAIYRTGTTSSGLSSYFENEASNPNTQYVVNNTFASLKARFVSSRLGFISEHWNASLTYRNPAYTYAGPVYAPDGPIVAGTNVRFIRHDDVVYDYSPSQVIWQYRYVDPAFGSFSAISGNSSFAYADVAAVELTFDLPVDPVKVVDVSTLAGQRSWLLDSNNKIIEIDLSGSGFHNRSNPGRYIVRTKRSHPDPTAVNASVVQFLHDSGSCLLVELSPPTSVSAGDGVLGVVMSSVISANDFVGMVSPSTTTDKDVVVIRNQDRSSNAAVQYQQSLGITYPQFVKAEYPRSSCASEDSVDALHERVDHLEGLVS